MTTALLRPDPFLPLASHADWGGRTTRAEVNLDAVAQNVQALYDLVSPSTLMAIVKADGYGHGAVMIAKIAVAYGAGYLGVYTVREAVVLREAGITAPILVLGPFSQGETASLWELDITPTLHNLRAADWLHRESPTHLKPFHVKVDTGLSRAGLAESELRGFLLDVRERFTSLVPEGLYTHFASADEEDASLTLQQLRRFSAVRSALQQDNIHFPIAHTSNSAALLSLPEARFDLVRAGIALYGYYPSPHVPATVRLRPALQLVSSISRVTTIPIGTGVGYSHEFIASRPTTVALVPIGYGDGLPRRLGNAKGTALVRSHASPIIGRVSMDQITLDVTDIPGVSEGDPVVLIGSDGSTWQDADRLATQADTISYDILTGLMPRIPRLYVKGGRVVSTLRSSTALQFSGGDNSGSAWARS